MGIVHTRREFMGYLLKPAKALFLSSNGLHFIKSWEGFEQTPKPDPVGNCTLGYGHKLADGPCTPEILKSSGHANGISKPQALNLLKGDIAHAERNLRTWLKHTPVTQAMYDALVSLTFNTGGNNGQWQVYQLTIQGRYQDAALEFLDIDKAIDRTTGKKVRLEGLTRRRQAEHDTYLRASYSGS